MSWRESSSVKVQAGGNYVGLEFEGYPLVVAVPPNEASQIRFKCDLNKFFEIAAVDIFHGHDRGDIFEMDTTIYGDNDMFIARRIEENESPSWRKASEPWALPIRVTSRWLTIYSTCRVTGASRIDNKEHPSFGKWRGNFDMNVKLIGRWI